MEEKREQEEYKHVCRLCNKKYPSGKSLGGHMRSHVISSNSYVPLQKLKSKKALTIKNKRVKNVLVAGAGDSCSSASGSCVKQEFKELTMKSYSDNEVGVDHCEKGSAKDARYRRIALIDSFSLENGYSSNKSEIEMEQEELALCLMMLSRDSSHRISTLPKSSAKNSVILEVRSSSSYVAKRKHVNCESVSKNNASKKLNCLEMDSSDSGYFENGVKEVESDDSADGYARNYEIKNPKSEFGSGCDLHYSELDKGSKNSGNYYSEKISVAPMEEEDELCNQDQLKKYMKKRVRAVNKKTKNDPKSSKTGNFGSKSISKLESYGGKISFTKGHCCPFCHKVFKSGQALGGHKRSHMTSCSSQDKANLMQSEENSSKNHHLLIDLNLPASPVEENMDHQDCFF